MLTEYGLKDTTATRYLGMINDKWRNQFYYDALNKHAQDKVVLDMGSGTGILSFYALAAGARFVYAIEKNQNAADLTYKVLKSKFDTSRFAVINCDFWSNAIDSSIIQHPIDLLVSETVGPGLFDQGMINTWNRIKSYLSPDAISIPDTLSCDLWVWQSPLDSAYLTTLEPGILSSDACIDQDFVHALVNATIDKQNMRWIRLNSIQTEPSKIYVDQVSIGMSNLPSIDMSAEVIDPKISFEFYVDGPATVSIVNKISFEDKTLFLKDAKYMPWKFAPTFTLQSAGKYTMVYNNLDLEHFCAEEWRYTV